MSRKVVFAIGGLRRLLGMGFAGGVDWNVPGDW